MPLMKFACPHCTQPLEIANEWAGQALTLPSAPAIAIPKVAPNPQASRRSFPSKPPCRWGGGFWKILLLILLAGAGLEAAPTPVDPIAWLIENKERASKEVTLQRPATLSLSANGKGVGSVTVPAGAKAQVVEFTSEAVGVRVGNAAGQIPIDATDLCALAKAEQEKAGPKLAGFAVPPERVPPVRPAATFPAPRFTHSSIPFTADDLPPSRPTSTSSLGNGATSSSRPTTVLNSPTRCKGRSRRLPATRT